MNVRPFLPSDFDDRFLQSAPADQQIDYLQGGEEVELCNLTPDGRVTFKLPHVQVPVTLFPKKGTEIEKTANLDTLVFEPDLGRFTLAWRAVFPLKRSLHEVALVVAGRMTPAWHRARKFGKKWYPNLEHAVAAAKSKGVKDFAP